MALLSTASGPSGTLVLSKRYQAHSDRHRLLFNTLEGFHRLPTKLMQLKSSVHYYYYDRHGQMKIALAVCYKISTNQ